MRKILIHHHFIAVQIQIFYVTIPKVSFLTGHQMRIETA